MYRIKKEGYEIYLLPGDLKNTNLEWLGVITRETGDAGALGYVKSTGLFIQANAGAIRYLDQGKIKKTFSEVITIREVAQ